MKKVKNTISEKNELMGIPTEPNKYLKSLLEVLYNEFGEFTVNSKIENDGLPIFLQRVLIGYMSSSTHINHIIKRFGINEVENDIEWLKELDFLKNSMDSKDEELKNEKKEFCHLINGDIFKIKSTISKWNSEKYRILNCLGHLKKNKPFQIISINETQIEVKEIISILEEELINIKNRIETEQHYLNVLKYELKEKESFSGDINEWINEYKVQLGKFRIGWNIEKKVLFFFKKPIEIGDLLNEIEESNSFVKTQTSTGF